MSYQPNNEDFRPTKTQQLSLKQAGEFDHKAAHRPLPWTKTCADRAARGISRKARIARKGN